MLECGLASKNTLRTKSTNADRATNIIRDNEPKFLPNPELPCLFKAGKGPAISRDPLDLDSRC